MAQADKSNTTSPSRRAVMAGGAAVSALAIIPATALPAIDGTDPIFAAIEKHRQTEAAFAGIYDNEMYKNAVGLTPAVQELDERAGELCVRSGDVYVELVNTTPTTLAGCAALLRYLEAHERSRDRPALFANQRDLLSRIAAMLDAAAPAA